MGSPGPSAGPHPDCPSPLSSICTVPTSGAGGGGRGEGGKEREGGKEGGWAGRETPSRQPGPPWGGAGRGGGAGKAGREQRAGWLADWVGMLVWRLCCQDNSWLGKSDSGFSEKLERGMHGGGERWREAAERGTHGGYKCRGDRGGGSEVGVGQKGPVEVFQRLGDGRDA